MGSEIIIDNDNKKLWLEDIVKIISKESDLDEDRINLIIKEINLSYKIIHNLKIHKKDKF